MKYSLLVLIFTLSAVSYPMRAEERTRELIFVVNKTSSNSGELLDFILGIFLIDIYKDDIYLKGKKKCTW